VATNILSGGQNLTSPILAPEQQRRIGQVKERIITVLSFVKLQIRWRNLRKYESSISLKH
jgi:hypothetical protein